MNFIHTCSNKNQLNFYVKVVESFSLTLTPNNDLLLYLFPVSVRNTCLNRNIKYRTYVSGSTGIYPY